VRTRNLPYRDRRSWWRIAAIVILAAAPVLTVAGPAQAGDVWSLADLTAIAAAPPVSQAPDAAGDTWPGGQRVVSAYSTNFPGQGPMARVVYRTVAGHLQELRVSGGGAWQSRQLTTTPELLGTPFAYSTNLTGEGPVARVVYLNNARQVMELRSSDGNTWVASNLTGLTGAPLAVDEPVAYVTNLTGQGPVARVVYNAMDGQVYELGLAGGGSWHSALIDVGTYGSNQSPYGYVSYLPGQGPVARVLKNTGGIGVAEFSVAGGGSWQSNFLTGAQATGMVIGYSTDLAGQGPVARVVYRNWSYQLVELSTAGGPWQTATLTATADANSIPSAYTTGKADPAARVVYSNLAQRVVELKVLGGGAWQRTDLTGLVNGPPTQFPPFGYATNLTGQGSVARVLYVTADGHVQELSTAF
jgi:hypothetical protein